MLEKRRFLRLFLMVGIIVPLIAGSFGISAASSAREISELGSKNPGILPISPFYFLKQWRRDIIRSFTKDPLSQAVFELDILDEKAAELKRVRDLRPDDTDIIAAALKNYKSSQMSLKNILKEMDSDRIKSDKKERLVEEIVKRIAPHEEYLEILSNLYEKEDKLRPLTRGAQELSVEVVKASQIISKEKFEGIAEEYLHDDAALPIIAGELMFPEGNSSSSSVDTTTTISAIHSVSSTSEEFNPAIIKESNQVLQ